MKIDAAVPVLCVREIGAASAFYAKLGFAVQASYGDYALLARDGVQLHLRVAHAEEGLTPEHNPCGAYLFVADADALASEWELRGVPLLSRPADQPYGVREFALSDADGNLLRVGEVRRRAAGDPGNS